MHPMIKEGNVDVALVTSYLVHGSTMVLDMVFDGVRLASRLWPNQKKDHGQLEKKGDASHSKIEMIESIYLKLNGSNLLELCRWKNDCLNEENSLY